MDPGPQSMVRRYRWSWCLVDPGPQSMVRRYRWSWCLVDPGPQSMVRRYRWSWCLVDPGPQSMVRRYRWSWCLVDPGPQSILRRYRWPWCLVDPVPQSILRRYRWPSCLVDSVPPAWSSMDIAIPELACNVNPDSDRIIVVVESDMDYVGLTNILLILSVGSVCVWGGGGGLFIWMCYPGCVSCAYFMCSTLQYLHLFSATEHKIAL